MKIDRLKPLPTHRTRFAWSHHLIVPEAPGCYALCTHAGDLLYVGLASRSIRSRIGTHLDTTLKRKGAQAGVPFWVHYCLCSNAQVERIERGWMNQAILEDGDLPPLNRVYSPL